MVERKKIMSTTPVAENIDVSVAFVKSKQGSLKAIRSTTTLIAHFLIVTVVCVSLIFAYRNGFWNLSATSQHIILCVLGYHFLMAEAILTLAVNPWFSMFSLKQRRRVHWFLQTIGSILALSGGILKSIDKNNRKGINWNTLHGQFGLASMIFTTICLLNGLTTLYAHELRYIVPRTLTKLFHIICGIVAISTASICLSYGFDKESFRSWAGSFADIVIIMTVALGMFVIINPLITFYTKFKTIIKK